MKRKLKPEQTDCLWNISHLLLNKKLKEERSLGSL
jgi:hypothetical protein